MFLGPCPYTHRYMHTQVPTRVWMGGWVHVWMDGWVRECMCEYVRLCVRACVRACVSHGWVRACVGSFACAWVPLRVRLSCAPQHRSIFIQRIAHGQQQIHAVGRVPVCLRNHDWCDCHHHHNRCGGGCALHAVSACYVRACVRVCMHERTCVHACGHACFEFANVRAC